MKLYFRNMFWWHFWKLQEVFAFKNVSQHMKQQLLLPGLPFRTGICWSITTGGGGFKGFLGFLGVFVFFSLFFEKTIVMRNSFWILMAISDIRPGFKTRIAAFFEGVVHIVSFLSSIIWFMMQNGWAPPFFHVYFFYLYSFALQNFHALVSLGGQNPNRSEEKVVRVAPVRCPSWSTSTVGKINLGGPKKGP